MYQVEAMSSAVVVGQFPNDNRFQISFYMDDIHISYRHPNWKVVERKRQNSINTVDSAKRDSFCHVLTLTRGFTMVLLQEISDRKYVYPIENLILSMSYSCQFCT